jgi:glycosyltransferase involved in cell wall biosynthesis
MKILMIAPEPFFQPRGTPFSVFHRTKALAGFGHEIDILTYHLGEDVDLPNTKIYRVRNVPFIKQIIVGPSFKKFFLNFLIFFKGLSLLKKGNYDCIHAHEEGGLFGIFYRKLFRLPLVYDMHSSIPEQIVNFNFFKYSITIRAMSWFEKRIIKNSDAVIGICPHLVETVHSIDRKKEAVCIENTPMVEDLKAVDDDKKKALLEELGIKGMKIALYTGTFENYQGMDLLIDSIPFVIKGYPNVKFVLVGGKDWQVASFKKQVEKMNIAEHVLFTGQRPFEDMDKFMAIADILLSPRKVGTNTPLKLYSYLKSGKPIVATDLLTHTQVLNPKVAILTKPTPESYAKGIIKVLNDPESGENLGRAGKELMERDYNYDKFLEKTKYIYDYMASIS